MFKKEQGSLLIGINGADRMSEERVEYETDMLITEAECAVLILALEASQGHLTPNDVVAFQRQYHAVMDTIESRAKAIWGEDWNVGLGEEGQPA